MPKKKATESKWNTGTVDYARRFRDDRQEDVSEGIRMLEISKAGIIKTEREKHIGEKARFDQDSERSDSCGEETGFSKTA